MIKEQHYYDELEDKLVIKKTHDVTPILEANKRRYNDSDGKHRSEAMNHVASIPMVIIDLYRQKGIDLLNDRKELRKFLNDPDNKFFRTMPGDV